ncbi:N-acetyltransferase [Romboutsia weinsteinii]|uniref:N-acetyltransferase n=1 Tax=Romboutsia weinsteinii TaxID=2020949 RepID=A0A371J2V2_9FIRM|nr:GNAT family protein [Romboutsia weinsteinii]RDY27110.1 N-acetyltransferase [Romboutsia weinsteinii]
MITHKGTETINTDRLILRRYKSDDTSNMYKNWASCSEVTKFLSWAPHTDEEFTKKLISEWISEYEDKKTYHWVIELKENKKVIGDISSFNLNDKHCSCEIGYCLSRDYWNSGIMSESLNSVINYLFKIGFNRIVAMHDTSNPASGQVMLKNNMKYEGTLRQAHKLRGNSEFSDLSIYSILKSEWNNNK